MADNPLIAKVISSVTVDYARLTLVKNPDGFLTNDAIRGFIRKQYGIEIINGSQLDLRIHFELEYKQNKTGKYIYIVNTFDTLLPDMREEGVMKEFSISDVFPLFSNKQLVRKQPLDILERLYRDYSKTPVYFTQCSFVIENIRQRIEQEKQTSISYFKDELRKLTIDWNQQQETIEKVCTVYSHAIKAEVSDELNKEIAAINESFQKWIDKQYFATRQSIALNSPKCVNKILPYLTSIHSENDKVALLVVDGFSYWQYVILREYLRKAGLTTVDKAISSWLPSITMLSRQAIFRGDSPNMDYRQNPNNEAKLWKDYWSENHFSSFEIQYLSDADEFAINDGVKRLAVVTTEMDEKMHAVNDYKELWLLTDYWSSRIIKEIEQIISMGFVLYLTTDHGSVLSHGWRQLTQREKVYLYKDGSRGARHLIYNDINALQEFKRLNADLDLLQHDNWLCMRDNRCFANENTRMITHGGSHFLEVVIPFVKITK